MIVCLIIIAIFIFKYPEYDWLCLVICISYMGLKSWLKESVSSRNKDIDYDEFDFWYDDQGLC